MSTKDTKGRRQFIGTMIGAATAASLTSARVSSAATAELDTNESWLKGLDAPHRCLFDFPAHKNGAGLVHMFNYIATFKAAYGVEPSEINTIGTLYSAGPASSITMAFTDEMWAKYRFGEYHDLNDLHTGKPAERNLFYKWQEGDELPRVGTIGPFPEASVSAMQEKMGTTFLLCNNAVIALGMDLERLGRGKTDEIVADLKNHIQPGVHLVPAMVIAIDQAQAAGFSYNKQ